MEEISSARWRQSRIQSLRLSFVANARIFHLFSLYLLAFEQLLFPSACAAQLTTSKSMTIIKLVLIPQIEIKSQNFSGQMYYVI